jgi:hypothetical protein
MTRPLASVLLPGGCITADADLIRDLTSLTLLLTNALLGAQPSLRHRHLSYHHLDPQGRPTCCARNPARPKNGCFWAVNIRWHVALPFSTMPHTLTSIVQTRCRN